MPGMCEVHRGSDPPKPPLPPPQAAPLRNGPPRRSVDSDQAEVHPVTESTRAAQLGGTAVVSFEGERLAQLAGAINARLADRPWVNSLRRWHAGEPLSLFRRKTLAVMLARARDSSLDWEECARAKALPERNH
jgi:hypothetical protein